MIITSRKNDAVKRFRDVLREKRLRDSEGVFAAEGDHLCGELARCGFRIKAALATEAALSKYPQTAAALHNAGEFSVISQEVAEYISDTKAPQGLFAIAVKPQSAELPEWAGRLVLLDGVQDPGNVGTILRTAEALGFDGAVLSPECADIWSPKTLRASMGSVFRLPCIIGGLPGIISGLKDSGFRVYGSMLDSSAARLGTFDIPERCAVVIGSEGAGISADTANACDQAVYIPISGAESLNAGAAAAILLWELSKR